MAPEWTDEKHGLFLKSMESTFVNQLYRSIEMFGLQSHKSSASRSKSLKQKQTSTRTSGQVWFHFTFVHQLLICAVSRPSLKYCCCICSLRFCVMDFGLKSTSKRKNLNMTRERSVKSHCLIPGYSVIETPKCRETKGVRLLVLKLL